MLRDDPAQCAALLRQHRVGGDFWRPDNLWNAGRDQTCWDGDASDDTALLARLAGLDVRVTGEGRFAQCASRCGQSIEALVAEHILKGWRYQSPFDGAPISAADLIGQLGDWRGLIDRNRGLGAIYGVARWKRPTVSQLLWGGADPLPYRRDAAGLSATARIAVWKSRTPRRALAAIEQSGAPIAEIEDGFIRSSGLGADCVPPLSIVVDDEGIYFDPGSPSALETLLCDAEFDQPMLDRAERLGAMLVARGIGKYGAACVTLPRPAGVRRHVLVTGQVEDDRSVLNGGGPVRTNLELLRRARAAEPDAFMLFKPHPDVEAGHRRGHVADSVALTLADIVVRDQPITALLDMVDAVHVLTSLAGFEALIRGKHVTTHGMPFYAGWGLTTDLAPVPSRRRRNRSLAELIAATLIVYPRYVDPLTRLPCDPERVIERMANGIDLPRTLLTRARQMQGKAAKHAGGVIRVLQGKRS